jgi:hypothetical protein
MWGKSAPGWQSWQGVLGFFLVAAVIGLVFLPFHFRFGLGRGGGVFLAASLPLGLALGLAVRLLGGRPGAPGVWPSGSLPSEALQAALSSLATAFGAPATLVLTLGATALIGVASLRLSLRAQERRDL